MITNSTIQAIQVVQGTHQEALGHGTFEAVPCHGGHHFVQRQAIAFLQLVQQRQSMKLHLTQPPAGKTALSRQRPHREVLMTKTKGWAQELNPSLTGKSGHAMLGVHRLLMHQGRSPATSIDWKSFNYQDWRVSRRHQNVDWKSFNYTRTRTGKHQNADDLKMVIMLYDWLYHMSTWSICKPHPSPGSHWPSASRHPAQWRASETSAA